MTWYARIINDLVVEPAIELPGSDLPAKYFGALLSGSWVEAPDGTPQSGWSYTAPVPPATVGSFAAPVVTLSLAQQAAAAIQAGLTISLSGTVSLAATLFPTDAVTRQKLADVGTAIAVTGGFPDGLTTMPMKDTSGVWHSFALSVWKAVAGAIASYATVLQLIIDGNPNNATSLPASSVALTV